MKIHGSITICNQHYQEGDFIPWNKVYPFFLLHMLVFGGSGFYMAYFEENLGIFLYLHGGFAILMYTVLYLIFFGRDEVKWMFINSALGFAAIYTQIDWILRLFNKTVDDFPLYIHVIPSIYFILYTFLLRQAFLDITRSREDKGKEGRSNFGYIAISVFVYVVSYLFMK